jgi:hypothetical protein
MGSYAVKFSKYAQVVCPQVGLATQLLRLAIGFLRRIEEGRKRARLAGNNVVTYSIPWSGIHLVRALQSQAYLPYQR